LRLPEIIEAAKPVKQDRRPAGVLASAPQRLREISGDVGERLFVPVEEFSRVLGGGIVPGSIILLGGDPGIGKTTLLTQLCGLLAENTGTVLYVSGEESTRQIKLRADRLGVEAEDLFLLTETNLTTILDHVQRIPIMSSASAPPSW